MAAIGFLLVIGYLLLPIIAIVWAHQNGQRLDRLTASVEKILGGAAGLRRDTPAPPKTASAPAPEKQVSAPQEQAPEKTAAKKTAPAAAAHTPRRDSVFADETVYSGADGEMWMDINDAPAAKTAYFDSAAARRAEEERDYFDRLWRWTAENWMLATGAVFVLMSISWLVRYALIEEIISAEMRIGAGFVLGLLLAALGQWRMRSDAQQGAIFLVLGSGAVMLTMFAAREIYGFFSPPVALGVSFLTAVYVTAQAMRARLPALSYAGLTLAMLAPAITRAPDVSFSGLFGYLAVVLAATLWVVLMTGWRKNILFALGMVTFYSFPFWDNLSLLPSKNIGLATAFGFAAVFFIADMVGHFRAVRNGICDVLMPLLLAFFLTLWITEAAPPDVRALWLLLWAFVFFAGSAILSKRTGAQSVFYTYLAVAGVLVVATTMVEFRGAALVVMLTLQSAALVLLCRHVLKTASGTTAAAFTMIVPLCLGVASIEARHWAQGIWQPHALVLLTLALVPLALAWHFLRRPALSAAEKTGDLPPHMAELCFWVVSGSLYGYAFIWRAVHATLVLGDFATALCMIVYSIIGIAAYMAGHSRGQVYLRYYGGGLMALVIGRLLLVDLPAMPVAARIVMFFGVGVLLLGTAFIKYRKKDVAG
ncbi:MAG: DUF2339 domain-containing protein [Alphaproteobacteria bacterium]|nr:DUF2339 domain-containing protein [Alphaproteobacteria bacterium]